MTPFTVTNFTYDGITFNVSGDRDADDCWITRVTVADSKVDISELFPIKTLEAMAYKIDEQLSAEEREEAAEDRYERRRDANQYAAERYQFEVA